MAPRKVKTIKKKTTASSKTKVTVKKIKKTTVTLNPFESLDKLNIPPLGERRDNVIRIAKESHDFDLKTRIPMLLNKHPNHNVCISGGSPELSIDNQRSIPNQVVILVPNAIDGLPPPFVAITMKDKVLIQPFSKHKLSWHKVAPRVYILKSNKRMTQAAIRTLDEDTRDEEEQLQLWTIVPRQVLQLNANGVYDIRYVNYTIITNDGKPLFGDYEKGDGLADHIDNMIELYGTELDNYDDPEEAIKTAIKKAFEDARDLLQDQVDKLDNAGYSTELLDAIKTVKVYPKGTEDSEKSDYINKHYGRAHEML